MIMIMMITMIIMIIVKIMIMIIVMVMIVMIIMIIMIAFVVCFSSLAVSVSKLATLKNYIGKKIPLNNKQNWGIKSQ